MQYNKGRKTRLVLGICLIIVVISLLVVGYYFYYLPSLEDKKSKKPPPIFVNGELTIHFLMLGNKYIGDSILIQCGDNDILVDAGSRKTSAPTLINYIDQYVKDNTLEYVIATHSDQDHISAFISGTDNMGGIFGYYNVKNIIDFPRTNKTASATTLYGQYCADRDAEVEGGANHWTALECFNEENGAKRKIQLSKDVELEILYNYYYENKSSTENNYSVCFMLNQGTNHYLFTGDLEEAGESRLVDYYNSHGDGLPHCQLYKAGHHGSDNASSKKLLDQITPDYVCICTCAGSTEYSAEFPYQSVIERLSHYTDAVYITTEIVDYSAGQYKPLNGNIVFDVKDGVITITCSNSNLKLKDSDWFKNNRECPAAWK